MSKQHLVSQKRCPSNQGHISKCPLRNFVRSHSLCKTGLFWRPFEQRIVQKPGLFWRPFEQRIVQFHEMNRITGPKLGYWATRMYAPKFNIFWRICNFGKTPFCHKMTEQFVKELFYCSKYFYSIVKTYSSHRHISPIAKNRSLSGERTYLKN